MQSGGSDGWRSIAAKGFEDEVQGHAGRVQLAVLILSAEIHFPVGHRQYPLDIWQCTGTGKGLLQQALAIGQAHERFRHGFARNRPKASAGAAGDDAGDQNAHFTALSQGTETTVQ
ncbi:hypothetical protein D3C76_1580150 [compost metagenome]